MTAKVLSVNVSGKTGEKKRPVAGIELKMDHGIVGDAHARDWHRQVSLLAQEDIDTMNLKGFKVSFGDFAENITTQGIQLGDLPVGTRLQVGEAILEVTQIGKECHEGCAIRKQVGDCVMPRRGIFTKVLQEGSIKAGDRVILKSNEE